MPYGVADSLWRMLPPDDQAAVRAGYEAEQASQPPAPAPPPEERPIVRAGQAFVDVGDGTVIAAPPASGPATAGAGPDSGGTASAERELAAFEVYNRNDPGVASSRLPSTAWIATRDYFAKDQPFLGTHIRNQGRQLRGVVASDLWSPST